MKEKTKKGWARILTALLIAAVVIGFMPKMGMTAYTASGDPAMNPGADVLKQNVNTSDAEIIWYADKAWLAIGYDGIDGGATSKSGAVTLLAVENLKQTPFDENSPYSNVYADSTLKTKVDAIADTFSAGEQGAIVKKTLVHGDYNGSDTDCIAGDEDISDVLLWPLSTKEANAVNSDLRIADPEHTGWASSYWWLRSPGDGVGSTALVYGLGGVGYSGISVSNTYGVRPAFDLNLESVLFTSAAESGKSSGAEGADALEAQSEQTNSGNEWKVTLQSGHDGFQITECTPTKNSVTVEYKGAETGDNEYVSAVIIDNDGKITYYGRIAKASDEDNASVTINTAGKLADGDTLYVFNEQYNGDKKTDYAGALQEVTIPDPISYDVTFKVVNGSWNESEGDAAKADQTVTLTGYEADPPKLTAEQIPAVGDKPDATYKAGAWDTVPGTETTITEDTIYTYTYAKKDTISAEVTFKVVNGSWNDGTTEDVPVTLTGYEGDTLKLTPNQIPAAGSKPDKNYKAGSWDTKPSTEAAITGNTTYTYTYEKDNTPIYYTIRFVDGQGKTLKTEKVESGKAAIAPADPKMSGYTFTGWDKDFSKITADMTVTAQWKKNTEPAPAAKISGTLLSKMTAKGKSSLVLTWNKVKGAEGYDIFFIKCSKEAPKKVKTIKGNKTFKWTKKNLKTKKAYKAIVKAYVMKNGKKTYVWTSPMVYAYTSGGTKNYTNSKGVTVKKTTVSLKAGKTYKIKANVTKLQKSKKLMPTGLAPKLRYVSSNKKIATVSKSGKITAKSNGSCKVYVIAANGAKKAVTVTVK